MRYRTPAGSNHSSPKCLPTRKSVWTKICTQLFIAALFIIAQNYTESDRHIIAYVLTMNMHHSATQSNAPMLHTE